jgi:protein-disulfide isomerase
LQPILRSFARGRILLLGVTIIVIASVAVLYTDDKDVTPLTTIAERTDKPQLSALANGGDEPRLSTPANGSVSTAPVSAVGAVLAARRDELERDRNAPVLGNPEGDVTIVEFFDYNCPYCKRIADDLKALIASDPGVRLVYREWPIINQGSQFAARAALAARRQGRYEALHWALMEQPRVTEQSTMRAARAIGLDMPRLLNDMNHRSVARHIALSMDLTRSLGINGTPSFVIGDKLAKGIISADDLARYVRDARAAQATSNEQLGAR